MAQETGLTPWDTHIRRDTQKCYIGKGIKQAHLSFHFHPPVHNFIKWNHMHPSSRVPHRIGWSLHCNHIAVQFCPLPRPVYLLSCLSIYLLQSNFYPRVCFYESFWKRPTCSHMRTPRAYLKLFFLPVSPVLLLITVLLSGTEKPKKICSNFYVRMSLGG